MSDSTKTKPSRIAVTVLFSEKDHDDLSKIGASTGQSLAGLARLGTQNLISHVRKTGQLPIPQVDLEEVPA